VAQFAELGIGRGFGRQERSASKMGADISVQIESLARTYERPALRKFFAAFPADSKVA
jgi:hypothetical protein